MANIHTTLTALFSAIANAIRGKTGSSDTIKADDFPSAIDAIETGTPLPALTNPASASDISLGKEVILPDANDQPVKVTGTAPYNFTSLATGAMTNLWKGATGFQSNKIVLNAPYATGLSGVFASALFAEGTEITVNAPLSSVYSSAFSQSSSNETRTKIVKITLNNVDFTKKPSFLNSFYLNINLVSVNGVEFDFSWISDGTPTYHMFDGCYSLETVRFKPNTLPALDGYAFYNCFSLNDASLVSIANGLKDGVTGKMLVLHATPKARTLEIMGNVSTVVVGEGTDEEYEYSLFTQADDGEMSLNAFITTVKGWTLA